MDENKWEYDYSSQNNAAGDTGYPNVGSSGMNTANTASAYGEESGGSYRPEPEYSQGGGATPPPAEHKKDKKTKKRRALSIVRTVAILLLALVMGFVGGFAGSRYGGTKVVVQSVERPSSSSESASAGTAAQSGSSGLNLSQVSALVSPSVVAITTEQVVYSQWSWFGQSQVQSGAGSGVIISSDGYILTCNHVVEGASNITVTIGDTDYTATVVGEDSSSDIAVIKVEATGLSPASVGDSDALTVGDEVIAVGNPTGRLSGTVTGGIISALDRNIKVNGNSMTLIQTDASISPGNSGGGLFNMAGELIGIVNAKSATSGTEGLGFAIPINDAISVAQELIEHGYVSGRPYMGITYVNVTSAQTAQQLGVSSYGVYIMEVIEGEAADKAGLQAGDRVVSVNDTEITTSTDFSAVIDQYAVGDTINITVARDGQMMSVSLTLGEMKPDNTAKE